MSRQKHNQLHIRIILGIVLLATVVLFFMPPIAQPLELHHFADSRTFIGIPNFLDATSSILFLGASIYGLKLLFDSRDGSERAHFDAESETIAYTVFFLASGLTCFGSIYYHLTPDNFSLVWDRLPMTIMFGSILAIVISERINRKAGLLLLPFLITLGLFSIWYWYQSELVGAGDLRIYLMVQFTPIILILYMLFFMPSRYSHGGRFGWILLLYALAKAAEFFDQQIFDMLQWISGHTIKHILAAMAVFALAEMLRCRIPINRVQKTVSKLDDY